MGVIVIVRGHGWWVSELVGRTLVEGGRERPCGVDDFSLSVYTRPRILQS